MVKEKKAKPQAEYRNLQLMEGRTDLWQFEVKDKSGKWHQLKHLGGDSEVTRKAFAQNTADHWINKKVDL